MTSTERPPFQLLKESDLSRLNLPKEEIPFARFELARSPEALRARLKALGFVGQQRVLDLACGIGHWSAAAATLNEHVVGLDLNRHRLRVAEAHAALNQLPNVEFVAGDMRKLPFEPKSFDVVFCYGAFSFVSPRAALKEMFRVLRPGGRLYLNANGWGWYFIEWMGRAIKYRDPYKILDVVRFVARTGVRRWRKKDIGGTVFTRKELTALCVSEGFCDVETADEGRVRPCGDAPPFYPGRLWGINAIFEVLARRPAGGQE